MLKRNYRKVLRKNRSFAAFLNVQFTVAESGDVTSCYIQDNDYVIDAEFEENIVNSLRNLKFRKIDKGFGEITLEMPLSFARVPADYNIPFTYKIPIFIPLFLF